MAINQNHLFEDLNGVKCAVIEKNVLKERVTFLTDLLTYNNFTVVSVPSPPPKGAPVAVKIEGENEPISPPLIETFTLGVTDVMFNATNAIFGRSLRTRDGHVVTLAFWEQKESISKDGIPYYEDV